MVNREVEAGQSHYSHGTEYGLNIITHYTIFVLKGTRTNDLYIIRK